MHAQVYTLLENSPPETEICSITRLLLIMRAWSKACSIVAYKAVCTFLKELLTMRPAYMLKR